MTLQCVSIRAKGHPEDRCSCKALDGEEWCGRHLKQKDRIRFVEKIVHIPSSVSTIGLQEASHKIHRAWTRWLARRAGPLLRVRHESNNPFDFFSSDPVEDIPIRDFISFVDGGKGYIMDVKSAISLLDHAKSSSEPPVNPFNRAPLPPTFYKRLKRHGSAKKWVGLEAMSEEQQFSLATTDMFRVIEDLGYYTNPQWFLDMSPANLQQLYIELADIWYHRAGLSVSDRNRIVPGNNPFTTPVPTVLVMKQKALRPLLLELCKKLVSSASAKPDKQLGVMYIIGSMALIGTGAAAAYPWLADMFSPGATRIVGGRVQILHPSVLAY